jgi:glutamine synthetase
VSGAISASMNIFQHFLEAKREEWDNYIRHVSSWETERYLRVY